MGGVLRGAYLGATFGPEGILIGGVVGGAAGIITGLAGGSLFSKIAESAVEIKQIWIEKTEECKYTP